MSNAANKLKYMVQDVDEQILPNGAVPAFYQHVTTYDNTDVIPLIDGNTYFNDLYDEILYLQNERLNGVNAEEQGIYLANWQFDKGFTFPNGVRLVDLLTTEAAAGVDVRSLIWVNDYAMDTTYNVLNLIARFPGDLAKFPQTNLLAVNVSNLETLIELTIEPQLREKVMLNTLDYPAGACHMKYTLVFGRDRSTGYTGGIDFGNDRKSDSLHYENADGPNFWHDIQAKVQGDAFAGLFDYYKLLWNELIDRYTKKIPTFLFNGIAIPAVMRLGLKMEATGNDFTHPVANNCSVQSLRTVPNQSYQFSMFTPVNEDPISFAPAGCYEIQLAVKKAISQAESYIYIEDQGVASREIYSYIVDAIKNNPDLKVIIITGYFDAQNWNNTTRSAISVYLLSQLNELQKEQVMIYSLQFKLHSKIYIIDDKFAIIGSSGLFNRALFVEFEHSISFIDSDTSARTVQDFRVDLWAEHFRVADNLHGEKDQLRDIDAALNVWRYNWGHDGTSFKLPGHVAGMTSAELVPYTRQIDASHPYPASLTNEWIFLRDQFDIGIPFKFASSMDTSRGEHKAPTNDMAQFVRGTTNSIEDNGLPHSDGFNLTGLWILILQGPNDGACLPIVAHSGKVIYVNECPLAFSRTTIYTVLSPYLLLQTVASLQPEIVDYDIKFEPFMDVGYIPPLDGHFQPL